MSRFAFLAAVAALLLTTACAKSPDPTVEELIKTPPPTFSGFSDHIFATPDPIYDLGGECDTISYGIQYSYDNKIWVELPGGCPSNGKFTLHFAVKGRGKNVWARARTKNGYTTTAHAFIRLLLPPTSPAYTFVASSNTDDEGTYANQNAITLNFDSTTMTSATRKMHVGAVGIVYGQ